MASSDQATTAGTPTQQGIDPSQLPPVQPPTATFILQLFLIPLVIVTIVVLLWLAFSWLAKAGQNDPRALVAEVTRGGNESWQKAYELADILSSPDPKYDEFRASSELARTLATTLTDDMAIPLSSKDSEYRIKRRRFICRVLATFTVPDGLDALCQAASQERDPLEAQVRLSALEAIALLAKGSDSKDGRIDKVRTHAGLMQTLLDASRAMDDGSAPPIAVTGTDDQFTTYTPRAEVRAVAAYTLGVVGGDEALARLNLMLEDPYANARYNAATGLARAGDVRAVGVLKEMLDPDNRLSMQDESNERDQENKRLQVIYSGLQATLVLSKANPRADLSKLEPSIERLANGDLSHIKLKLADDKEGNTGAPVFPPGSKVRVFAREMQRQIFPKK